MVFCVVRYCVTFQSSAELRRPFIRKYLSLLQNKFLEQMIYTAVVDGRIQYLSVMHCRRVPIATDILGLHCACHSLRTYAVFVCDLWNQHKYSSSSIRVSVLYFTYRYCLYSTVSLLKLFVNPLAPNDL
jgi:hypothetical protein